MGFPLVGVLGAGAEARLAYAAANRLGLRYRVLARTGRDSAARVVPDAVSGDTGDLHVLQAFADHCAVLLVADPDVPTRHLRALQEGSRRVVPSPEVLTLLDDPDAFRREAAEAGIPTGSAAGFDRLTILVARSPSGQAVVYPVAQLSESENRPETLVPAPIDEGRAGAAHELALRIAGLIDLVGVLAVDVSATGTAAVVGVEPLTTRNGGWTCESTVTDAFEQHLRAALDLPLGDPSLLAAHVVSADIVGRADYATLYPAYLHVLARDPALRVQMYGLDVADGRTVGHVTALGDNAAEVRERADHAAGYFRGDITE